MTSQMITVWPCLVSVELGSHAETYSRTSFEDLGPNDQTTICLKHFQTTHNV